MDTSALRKAGLTDSQAKGYLALVENRALTPAELAEKTGETRTNAYAIADKLVELGLATKTADSKNAYQAESPAKLKQLLVSKQQAIKAASEELAGILPSLLSVYRLTNDRPGVLYLEGADSLRLIYDDIIKTGHTVRIFPSSYDRDNAEIAAMIERQIERQRAAGIKSETLIREDLWPQFAAAADELFEARPAAFGKLETQILLYGDTVALTTFKNGLVSTVVTSPFIAQTFNQLFEALWNRPHASDT
jgi:sugar-specific transcriptional regulator TrmB